MSNWTIYNNTLTWEQLSDKKKGKFLLAAHGGVNIGGRGFRYLVNPVQFVDPTRAYFAIKPAAVKTELTMADLFACDWLICSDSGPYNMWAKMIAKGWKK
tara:strand:+ start:239 stop:538 length:300 start_codon:yes stop_codon:yes gene_type:complete